MIPIVPLRVVPASLVLATADPADEVFAFVSRRSVGQISAWTLRGLSLQTLLRAARRVRACLTHSLVRRRRPLLTHENASTCRRAAALGFPILDTGCKYKPGASAEEFTATTVTRVEPLAATSPQTTSAAHNA